METKTPDRMNPELFLAQDAENMDDVEYKDVNGTPVRFHKAYKEFYKIDSDGMWVLKMDKDGKPVTKRDRSHRFQKDATVVDRLIYVYEKADKGEKDENWFAEYIKLAIIQNSKGVSKDACAEFFIATYLNFCWGVQTLRTQVNLEKKNLKTRGVSSDKLDKVPTLKVKAVKPRPNFSKKSTKWTEDKINAVKNALQGL